MNIDEQEIALEFIDFLRRKKLTFYKDECECWKEKIYYWVKFNNECVCFIAIKDPEEPNSRWTVWSADMNSDVLKKHQITQELQEFLDKYSMIVKSKKEYPNFILYSLEEYPFCDGAHRDGAYIIHNNSGSIVAKCHHDSCKDANWAKL